MTLGQLVIQILMQLSDSSEKEVTSAVKNLRSKLTKLLSAIGITLSLKNINEILEQWNEVNKAVNNLNTELEDQYELQDKILEAANNTRLAYADMATYVTNLAKSKSSYFSTAEDAAEFLETANQLFQVAGATSSEISSLNSVITTTFTNGRLSASGFSTILSACPELVDYLAESLGVTTQQVKAMGSAGLLTSSQLYKAIANNTEAIETAYGSLSLTISDAVTIIKNKWGTWLSQMDQTYNFTDTIARLMVSMFDKVMVVLEKITAAFSKLSDILGSTEAAAKVLLGTIVALMAAFNATKIKNTYDALKSFYALLSTGKLATFISQLKSGTSVAQAFTSVFTNWKVLAIAAAITAVILLIRELIKFANGEDNAIDTLFEKLGVDGETLRETLQSLMSTFSSLFSLIQPVIQSFIDSIMPTLEELMESFKDTLGAIIQVIVDVINIIVEVQMAIYELLIPIIEALLVLLQPIIDLIELIAEAFTGQLSDAFNFITDVINDVINGSLKPLIEFLSYIIDFLSAVFAGDWEQAWDSLGNIVISVINSVIASFESMINFFIQCINSITSGLSSLWTWLGIPAIPEISEVSLNRIAYLAEGGYVEANHPTPVVIGDNTQEGEIVSPISKMRDTVLEALRMYLPNNESNVENNIVIDTSGIVNAVNSMSNVLTQVANSLSGYKASVTTVNNDTVNQYAETNTEYVTSASDVEVNPVFESSEIIEAVNLIPVAIEKAVNAVSSYLPATNITSSTVNQYSETNSEYYADSDTEYITSSSNVDINPILAVAVQMLAAMQAIANNFAVISVTNGGESVTLTSAEMRSIVNDAVTYLSGSLDFTGAQTSKQTIESQTSNMTINQSVYMYNTFEGTKEVQKTTSEAMKTSATDIIDALTDAINSKR